VNNATRVSAALNGRCFSGSPARPAAPTT